eukprot:227893_1
MPNHPNKRKSKRKQIHLTREYLESLGIPSFEDESYDNGYLYASNHCRIDDIADGNESQSDDTETTSTSYSKRIRPCRITKSTNAIKSGATNNPIEIDLDDDSDEESDSFYESDCNDSLPFAINTSSIHCVPLSTDLIKIIKSSHNINHNTILMAYDDDSTHKTNHNRSGSASNKKRVRSTKTATAKKQRRMNINRLDPLTKLFFEYAKEVTHDLIHHKKAHNFTELAMNELTKFEWNDVIKQIVDLETVNNQLINGHYFNDETYLISSFKQWKSDIKTVFENFAILYGPNKHRKNKNYLEIYNNCYVMLGFFNTKLMEIQKAIRRITKRSEDWNTHKKGKYSQYLEDKQEILSMIYDQEMDECSNRDIQSMDYIFICPKRKLQLKHGKFNKKHIDVLPLRTLQKLARRGFNRNNRKGVNGTAIREQKKYFWAQYIHSKNSLQSAMKKMQKESVRNRKVRGDNRNYCHDIEYSDDDIDSDEDFNMDVH